MSLEINNRQIGVGHKPYLIAEISANHDGNLKQVLKMIDAAKESGADAIKIQTYTAETMTIKSDRPEFFIAEGTWKGFTLFDLYKLAETPYEWHEAIFEYAKKKGITIFSSPFDESAVDLLESLNTPAYKVASFEITDIPLIKYIARTGKPMIISTGTASINEIGEALAAAREEGNDKLILLHCISSYPAPIETANLLQIKTLEETFKIPIGLSDHTLGTTASIVSVGLGAVVIEKHFTLDRNNKGPDSSFSIEPNEFKVLSNGIRDAWNSLGSIDFSRPPVEKVNKLFRRSIYFVRNMKKGEIVGVEDIRRIRPGMGLPPKYFKDLIGKKVKQDIDAGTPTSWDLFDI